ncbi:MAG: sigma-70 family RNA polymerase sigma factor [Planctomycetes bacterium]|nr:sigma-70 family RNA polymerase sigma factor [Planctomycetota bacterium]
MSSPPELPRREPDGVALDQLFPLVLEELRALARHHMRGQPASLTLQATALVNELYLRLAQRDGRWNDRAHFMRLAGRVMRQTLTDHARRRRAAKRNPGQTRMPLDDLVDAYEQRSLDIVDLDGGLSRLTAGHPELVELVELRFFAGRSFEEIADIIGISAKTARRRLQAAKILLREQLT